MNWEATTALAELTGAIAVVVSLVYLAVQVRLNSNQIAQNSQHIEASIYHSTNEAFINWFALIADNREASEIWSKVLSDADLDTVEKIRAHSLLSILFLSYEANYQQERLGVVTRSTLEMPALGDLIAAPAVSRWWQANGPRIFTPEFQDQIRRITLNAE